MKPVPHNTSTVRTALVVAAVIVVVFSVVIGAQVPHFYIPTAVPTAPAAAPTPIPPGSVQIEMVMISGDQRLPGTDSISWLPDMEADSTATDHIAISQKEKKFEPRVAVVSTGSTVDFPNFDRVFHNVFSLSTPKSFDLGLYRKGKSKSVSFSRPGLVQVYCNIHPHMAAYLMVVDSRRHAVADDNGRLLLKNVPVGRQRVNGWNVRGGMWSRQIQVRPDRTSHLSVEFDITSWREAQHLNKHGKEYPPPDDDDFRY